jgi:hypothetical protein
MENSKTIHGPLYAALIQDAALYDRMNCRATNSRLTPMTSTNGRVQLLYRAG